jgi:hypothetical protein
MQKPTKPIWQRQLIVVVIATVTFLFAAQFEVAAQSEIQFNVLYECPRSPHNFKVLSCPNEKYCEALGVNKYTPSASYKFEINKSTLIDVFKEGGCKVDGKPLEWSENTTPPENQPPNKELKAAENKPTQTGRFKVGDRVLASPMAMDKDEFFEKCTVIKDYLKTEGYDTYRVRCDDPKGGLGSEANVKVPFIKVWANAAPPPATPDCPFNEPAGTVSRTSKPSAELFRRIIFEKYRDQSNGRKVGITFQQFQTTAPYQNVLLGGAQLKHDGAPQGATIYPLKTKYLFCDQHTDSTIRWVIESQFACFKDKFGDWVCPVDSVPKYLEQIYLPNK